MWRWGWEFLCEQMCTVFTELKVLLKLDCRAVKVMRKDTFCHFHIICCCALPEIGLGVFLNSKLYVWIGKSKELLLTSELILWKGSFMLKSCFVRSLSLHFGFILVQQDFCFVDIFNGNVTQQVCAVYMTFYGSFPGFSLVFCLQFLL